MNELRVISTIIGYFAILAVGFFLAMFVTTFGASAEQFRTFGAIDGDTIKIAEPCNRFFPIAQMSVRVFGIDTPESTENGAKCEAELVLGKKAKLRAQQLIQRGDLVDIIPVKNDKYSCRIDGHVRLAGGRDYASIMIKEGLARPYGVKKGKGSLTKSDWCK